MRRSLKRNLLWNELIKQKLEDQNTRLSRVTFLEDIYELGVIGIIRLCKVICSIIVEYRSPEYFFNCLYLVVEILFRIVLVRNIGTWNLRNHIVIIVVVIITTEIVFKGIDIKVIEGDDRTQRTTITVNIIKQILCLGSGSNADIENMKCIRKRLSGDLLLIRSLKMTSLRSRL